MMSAQLALLVRPAWCVQRARAPCRAPEGSSIAAGRASIPRPTVAIAAPLPVAVLITSAPQAMRVRPAWCVRPALVRSRASEGSSTAAARAWIPLPTVATAAPLPVVVSTTWARLALPVRPAWCVPPALARSRASESSSTAAARASTPLPTVATAAPLPVVVSTTWARLALRVRPAWCAQRARVRCRAPGGSSIAVGRASTPPPTAAIAALLPVAVSAMSARPGRRAPLAWCAQRALARCRAPGGSSIAAGRASIQLLTPPIAALPRVAASATSAPPGRRAPLACGARVGRVLCLAPHNKSIAAARASIQLLTPPIAALPRVAVSATSAPPVPFAQPA